MHKSSVLSFVQILKVTTEKYCFSFLMLKIAKMSQITDQFLVIEINSFLK